jgi:predicted nucleotide-binding protein (sugar kinase/HSP70/actin superfamily)
VAVIQYTFTHKTIHRTTQNKKYIEKHKNFGRVQAVSYLCGFYSVIYLATDEKAWKKPQSG